MGIAQAQEPGRDEQQTHEDDTADLRHVAAKGRHDVDDELGRGLEVALGVGLGAEPRRRGDGLQIVGHTAKPDRAAVAQVHEVLRQHVTDIGVWRERLWWFGALLNDPDVEDAGQHEGEKKSHSVP